MLLENGKGKFQSKEMAWYSDKIYVSDYSIYSVTETVEKGFFFFYSASVIPGQTGWPSEKLLNEFLIVLIMLPVSKIKDDGLYPYMT